MIDFMKKAMLTGLGLAAMTTEKVEELAREFARQAQLSSEKGQEFVNEVVARSEKARQDMEAAVQRMVNDRMRQANIATRDDIATLTARIEQLERKLSERGPGQSMGI